MILHGDNIALLRGMPDNSADAIVTDPPYGLSNHDTDKVVACLQAWLSDEAYAPSGKGFMGKAWDSWVPSPVLWRECLRVLKPGGHLLAFSGTRSQDLMALGIRLAGFEIRDMIAWIYGCYSEDTQCLTKNGWKTYKDIIIGKIECDITELQNTIQGLSELQTLLTRLKDV